MTDTNASLQDMANAIRALSMDAVQKSNSGHPGMPMGMADIATILFAKHLKFDAANPEWPDRDRFVLSAGHGSMLLYALLHLTGYSDMTKSEVEAFRQLGSRTAGHPEFGHAFGIETTTGPLGQGIANAVGMALGEKLLATRFGEDLVDHHTYVVAGDGCLMEGISHEACSLAGHLNLSKLIMLYDDNEISIDGPTNLALSDDALKRFEAYGWAASRIDGHDFDAIDQAIAVAKTNDRPTIIACRTIIGKGAPSKQGTASTHGAPLGDQEIEATREAIGWPHPPFVIPDAIAKDWRDIGARGAAARQAWRDRFNAADQIKQSTLERVLDGTLPEGVESAVNEFKQQLSQNQPNEATRKSSQNVLEVLTSIIPEMIGGSADLTGSNNTNTKSTPAISTTDFSGRHFHYGVREHAMVSAMNGMALHGGTIPYGGTFLIFTDYAKPAIRLAALMQQRVIVVATHDSIGLGEDGPTHQPIEQLATLRATPNTLVFRPADAIETAECWLSALQHDSGPSVLALSRHNLPTIRTTHNDNNLSARGAYVISDVGEGRQVTLLATGGEVSIAMDAQKQLASQGIVAAVVSMPCWELFERQDAAYRNSVLGMAPRIAIEAAATFGWTRYVENDSHVLGMRSFGASAPAPDLFQHFGLTAERLVDLAKTVI